MGLRVLCIYTSDENTDAKKPLDGGSSIPFGLAMIATVLKEAGHDVSVLVLNVRNPFRQIIVEMVNNFAPQLVCMTSVSSHFELIKKISQTVKSVDPRIYTALGGHHASLNPDEAISCGFFDGVCLGEGEKGIVEVASILTAGGVPSNILNFWFSLPVSNTIEKNPMAPFNEDLDSLPFIDRNMWKRWIKEPDRRPSVLLGRGCPNSCSYCSNHKMRNLASGKYVRQRSPANVVLELNKICEENSITSIYLDLETITARINYALEISEALTEFNSKRSSPIVFRTNLSLSSAITKNPDVANQVLNAFSRANIKSLSIGLESGSERLRKEVLKRPHYSNEDFIQFCHIAKTYGIRVFAFVIIGLPSETLEDWSQTLDVLRLSGVQNFYPYIFYPYPGTEIATMAARHGFLKRPSLGTRERYQVVFRQSGFPTTQVTKEFVLCRFKVFKGSWPLDRRLSSVVRNFLMMHPILEPTVLFLIERFPLHKLFFVLLGKKSLAQVSPEDY